MEAFKPSHKLIMKIQCHPRIETGFLLLSTFFLTVATVLGTGILSLPCSIGESGFWPFFVSFLPGLFAQSLVLVFTVELLQKTQMFLDSEVLKSNQYREMQDLEGEFDVESVDLASEDGESGPIELEKEIEEEQVGEVNGLDENSERNSETLKGEDMKEDNVSVDKIKIKKNPFLQEQPNLHLMAKLFLPRPLQWVFSFIVMVHFISILISYALAGSRAFAHLVQLEHLTIIFIPPFVGVLAALVIFGSRIIHFFITGLTFFKGMMLIVMIIAVGILGFTVQHDYVDRFQYIARSYLIGTVSLGGAVNTLPILFGRLEKTKLNLHLFRFSAVFGIFVCFVLNVVWCYFILKIVPQTGENSLQEANEHGDISTIPLSKIIESNKNLSKYSWMIYVIQIFIISSITVSFITLGAALKHVLDGWCSSLSRNSSKPHFIIRILSKCTRWPTLVLQCSLYIFHFGFVIIAAMANPESFFLVIEVFTSMALNLESGLFIGIMLLISRKMKYEVVLPLGKFFVFSTVYVLAYFGFAILWDLFYTSLRLIYWLTHKNSDYEIPF